MCTREILTIQLGHYSNFVGTHFWNLQEQSFDYTGTEFNEINHDILYREGRTSKGEVTYTPRLLISDLKGSLKTLPETGGLDENTSDGIQWDSNVIEEVEEEKPTKNEFLKDIEDKEINYIADKIYDLDKDIETWTHYLYPRFHQRTVNIIKEYQHNNSVIPFDVFPMGKSLWETEYGEEFSDQIRRYIEECDSIQGFLVNFDCTDGFSGLASSCIEHLSDDYSKVILAHPTIASFYPDNDANNEDEREKSNIKDSIRLINLALTLPEVVENASMIVPLCTGSRGWRKPGEPRTFEYLNYNHKLPYHSSAILASALDTLSQKFRHVSNTYTLSDICADMTAYGKKMAAASLGLPFTMKQNDFLIDHLNNLSKPIYTCITPSCTIGKDKIIQMLTLKGIPETVLKKPPNEAREQRNLAAYRCNTIKEMMELYFQSINYLSPTNVFVAQKAQKYLPPYPRIFSEKLDKYGALREDETVEALKSVPILAGYHNGNFMSDTLEKMHRDVKRIKFTKLHVFKDNGYEETEYKEALDKLVEFKDVYDDNFEL